MSKERRGRMKAMLQQKRTYSKCTDRMLSIAQSNKKAFNEKRASISFSDSAIRTLVLSGDSFRPLSMCSSIVKRYLSP